MPKPKREASEPRVLTEAEYGPLRTAAAGDPRGWAIVELFLQTGIRLSEAAKLSIDDIALPEVQGLPAIGSLRVRGKGRKKRIITLNSRACEALLAHLATHPSAEEEGALSLSRKGARLSPRGIQHIVHRLMRSAGITGASVYTLWHTFATHTVRKGTNLRGCRRRWAIRPSRRRRPTSPWLGSSWTSSLGPTLCEATRSGSSGPLSYGGKGI